MWPSPFIPNQMLIRGVTIHTEEVIAPAICNLVDIRYVWYQWWHPYNALKPRLDHIIIIHTCLNISLKSLRMLLLPVRPCRLLSEYTPYKSDDLRFTAKKVHCLSRYIKGCQSTRRTKPNTRHVCTYFNAYLIMVTLNTVIEFSTKIDILLTK